MMDIFRNGMKNEEINNIEFRILILGISLGFRILILEFSQFFEFRDLGIVKFDLKFTNLEFINVEI
jgi:hypothetical protein